MRAVAMDERKRGWDAWEVKQALARMGVQSVLSSLGLLSRSTPRLAGGYMIRCPAHNERTPSCAVADKGKGIVWHCKGCDKGGSVLDLIMAVRGCTFQEAIQHGGELAGLVQPPDGAHATRPRTSPQPKAPQPTTEAPRYPPEAELDALLERCVRVNQDAAVAEYLSNQRGICPDAVAVRDLALALPSSPDGLPPWARRWHYTHHRIITPWCDSTGRVRSVTAWRIVEGEGAKRLAPSGATRRGLVLADATAREVLVAGRWPATNPNPPRVVVCEGEPDFVARAILVPLLTPPEYCVFGVGAGAWTEGIATRIPDGAVVCIMTHNDEPGERYARQIFDNLDPRCVVRRYKG